jgi:hypothetical protein
MLIAQHCLFYDKLIIHRIYLFSCPWTCRTPPGVAELTSGSLLLLLLPTAVTALLLPTAGLWVTRRLHLNYRGAGPRVPLSLYKYTCSEFIINGWLCIFVSFIVYWKYLAGPVDSVSSWSQIWGYRRLWPRVVSQGLAGR